MSSAQGQPKRQPSNGQTRSTKTDFMQTQTFHRRNMSNLLKMKEEEADMPDHMLVSRGGPLRRTLEQIEQGLDFYDEEGTLKEMMDSQDSAADNNFQDFNSNFHPGEEPQVPKDGFIDMVEHPSILDDDDSNDDEENASQKSEDSDIRGKKGANGSDISEEAEGDFPLTGRRKEVPHLNLDISESPFQEEESPPLSTPQNQIRSPQDQKMELSELHSSAKRRLPQLQYQQNQNRFTQDRFQGEAEDVPTGEISQATNESCSSLDTLGNPHNRSSQKEQRRGKTQTPNEAFDDSLGQYRPHSSQISAQKDTTKPLQVYQYYHNEADEDFEEDHNSQPSQIINTASPSPKKPQKNVPEAGKKKKFQMALQIEIDSDREDRARQPPPSAPKQGNYIQFEEVKDTSQQEEVCGDAYGFYGRDARDSDDVDTPGLNPRDGQILSQKMLTPNEQRMHSSYFHNNGSGQMRDLPSTKSYQNPVTHSAGFSNEAHQNNNATSPYLDQNARSKMPFKSSLHDDSASQSTVNPQYYYQKINGQICYGQQESQSRASDRIYEKGAGISPSPDRREDNHGHQQHHQIKENDNQERESNRKNSHFSISKEKLMEAEIRRLEELNRIDAQRLREPVTTDEESPVLSSARIRRLQEEETKENCPDEYNLLEANESQGLDSVELLKNATNPDLASTEILADPNIIPLGTPNNNVKVMQLQDNEDINDRESAPSESTRNQQLFPANGSFGTSQNGGGNSKHLYVITEESQSLAGGQTTIDPSRMQEGVPFALVKNRRSGGSGFKHGVIDPYGSQEQLPFEMQQSRRLTQGSSNTCKEAQRSPPLMEITSSGRDPKTAMNRTMKSNSPHVQKFNDYCENQQNEISDQNLISMSQIFPSADVTKEESTLDLQHQRSKSQHHDLLLNNMMSSSQSRQSPIVHQTKQQHRTVSKKPPGQSNLPQFAPNSSVSVSKENDQTYTVTNGSVTAVQGQPRQKNNKSTFQKSFNQQNSLDANALAAMQLHQSSLGSRDQQELLSMYLKQSAGDRRNTFQNMPDGLELASDEDLLGSNFDRISKILPNHDMINEQLPDFNENGGHQQISPARRGTTDSANDQAVKMQILSNEIAQLKQIILQRNQVIQIKDNTILELKAETGMRSSTAGQTTKGDQLTKDVACLANPDTREVKCQTYGPRKTSYYKSIPAKVQTGLGTRSQDSSQERIFEGHTTIVYANQKETGLKRQTSFNKKISKASPGKEPVNGAHNMSNSQSPGRRRLSPRQYQGDNSFGTHQTREDVRSLRFQLTALKEQLRAQEEDTENYIAKVTYQEKIIEAQEKNYDILQLELEENRVTNANLVERNEELIKQVDSILAEYAELKQMKSLSEKSGVNQMLLSTQKFQAEVVEFGMQTDENQWNDFLTSFYRQQRQAEHDITTDNNTAAITSARSGLHNVSFPTNLRNNLGAGLFPSHQNSRILEHFSDAISGEQGTGQIDYDRLQNLIDQANSYEQQQTTIEQEINQYKRLLQEVQVNGSGVQGYPQSGPRPFNLESGLNSADQTNIAVGNHNQADSSAFMLGQSEVVSKVNMSGQPVVSTNNQHAIHHHVRNPSNITQVTASPLLNVQDYMNSGTISFEFNKNSSQNLATTTPIGVLPEFNTYGTGPQTHTSGGGVVSMNQQLAYMSSQYVHYKRKAKKLQKRCQKLEFEKMADDKTIQEMTLKMQELNERYRDLRQKYQLKLQEKNLKISELKQQVQRQLFSGGGLNNGMNTTQLGMVPQQQPVMMVHPNPQQYIPSQHMTSKCDISVATIQHQRQITPVQSNDNFHMINVSQEDNKGTALAQKYINRNKAGRQDAGSAQRSQKNQAPEQDFYEIVSGMVDQRIAETSFDNMKQTAHSRNDTQVNNRGQTMESDHQNQQQVRTKKKDKYPRRPDLEILRHHNARLQEMSSPSNIDVSPCTNSEDEEPTRMLNLEIVNRRNRQMQEPDSETVNDRESSAGRWNQQYPQQYPRQNNFTVTNSSSTAQQLIQQSRNSRLQPQHVMTHEEPSSKQLMSGIGKRSGDHQQTLQTHHPQVKSTVTMPKNQTLAESYAKKRGKRRSSEAKSSPPSKKFQAQRKASSKRFRSKSSEKRDHSLKSAVSKDDVMPCYKHKVQGRKRNEVEYFPQTSLLTYLQPQQSHFDENASSVGNHRHNSTSSSPVRKYPRSQQRQGSSQQKERRYQQQPGGKISQMLQQAQLMNDQSNFY